MIEVLMRFKRGNCMASCFDIAHYFLTLEKKEDEPSITPLKLQKLIYYAQGFHVAIFDKPLFNEEIYAWKHGPIVDEIYHHYKKYRDEIIPSPEDEMSVVFSKEIKNLLDAVYQQYGQYSAWKLSHLTHVESPWKKYSDCLGSVIPVDEIAAYFRLKRQNIMDRDVKIHFYASIQRNDELLSRLAQ
jgi:uncharacterized phage-associated protein